VVELNAESPCAGLLPIEAGACALSEVTLAQMTMLTPYKGKEKQLDQVLKDKHGMGLATPNRSTGKAGSSCIWFGYGQAMLIGPVPDPALAEFCAVVDQSDAWAVVRLQGAGAADVLARLTSIDLRGAKFKRGHTARTELRHMMVSITHVGPDAYQIMAFCSMAGTLVHDLNGAMLSVAAQ